MAEGVEQLVDAKAVDRAGDQQDDEPGGRVVTGAGDDRHQVGPGAVPTGRVRDPLLLPVDDPVPVLAAGRRPQAVLGAGFVEVGRPAGLAEGERRERGTGGREERRQVPLALVRAAGPQQRGETEPGREQVERDAGVTRDELLGQDRGGRRPGAVAAEGLGDEPAQEPGRDHLLVERPGRAVALGRRRQRGGRLAGLGQDVTGELSGRGAQRLLS